MAGGDEAIRCSKRNQSRFSIIGVGLFDFLPRA